MTFVRRALAFGATLALLALAGSYLPAPVSTVAWGILGILLLLLFLPLLLALVSVVSGIFSDDDEGWFSGILDAWFLWSALEWPWTVLGWVFGGRRRRRRRDDGNGGGGVADGADFAAAVVPEVSNIPDAPDIPEVTDARRGRGRRRRRSRPRRRMRAG